MKSLNTRKYINYKTLAFDKRMLKDSYYSFSNCKKLNNKTCIMMIDIDNFKKYTKNNNIKLALQCISQIRSILKYEIDNSNGILFRFSLDKFIIFLPESDKFKIINICENILQNVRDLNILHLSNLPYVYTTVSIGVTTFLPREDRNIKDYVKVAESALFRAKFNGKSRFWFTSIEDNLY